MGLNLFEYLAQSIAITDSMFKFGKFFTKNAITFDRDRKKRNIFHRHKILLCIQCCYHKISNSQDKKQLFANIFFNKIVISPKSTDFFKCIMSIAKQALSD